MGVAEMGDVMARATKRRKCPTCRRKMRRVQHADYDWMCPLCGHVVCERLEQILEASGMRDELPPEGAATHRVHMSLCDCASRSVRAMLQDGRCVASQADTARSRLSTIRRLGPKVSVMDPADIERLSDRIERKF